MYFNLVEFGRRVRELRIMKGMKQEDLANEMGVSYVHLNRIECGKNGPSIDLLLALSCFFDVSIDYLVTGKDFKNQMAKKRLEVIMSELGSVIREME